MILSWCIDFTSSKRNRNPLIQGLYPAAIGEDTIAYLFGILRFQTRHYYITAKSSKGFAGAPANTIATPGNDGRFIC